MSRVRAAARGCPALIFDELRKAITDEEELSFLGLFPDDYYVAALLLAALAETGQISEGPNRLPVRLGNLSI